MNIDRITHGDARPAHVLDTITSAAESGTSMRVTKRSGRKERVNLDKIVRAIGRCATGLDGTTRGTTRAARTT